MKKPIITYTVFETAPRMETGAYNIGWPASPDLVEASDQIVWSDKQGTLVDVACHRPIMVEAQSTS